jgi:hypothetical protein
VYQKSKYSLAGDMKGWTMIASGTDETLNASSKSAPTSGVCTTSNLLVYTLFRARAPTLEHGQPWPHFCDSDIKVQRSKST